MTTKRKALPPIRSLICCCCGSETKGRQWWNRDTGYGLCVGCIDLCAKGVKIGEKTSSYGVRGLHFDVEAKPEVTVVCQWCLKIIGYKPCVPTQHGKQSHGGCRECWKIHGIGEPTPEMEQDWTRYEASLKERMKP